MDSTQVINFQIGEQADGTIQTTNKAAPKVQRDMFKKMDSRDYLMAYKAGFLYKSSKTFYRKGLWDKRFYVLCTIGLVYMVKPSEKDVKLFDSQDFKVVPVPFSTLGKTNVFELRTLKGGSHNIVLQASSKEEYEEWIKAFEKFQKKLAEAKAQILGGNQEI